MNKKEIYKQGVSNASSTYQRKFNQLSEMMRESIEKQNNINESFLYTLNRSRD